MNQPQPYMEVHHPSHVSASQPYGSLPASGGGPTLSQYGQSLLQHQGSYPSTPSYPTYSYSNGVISPQSQASQHGGSAMGPAMLPHLPAMNTGATAPHSYGATQYMQHPVQTQPFDTTGQVAPPGMKPRVTATLWEDEGSLCFQVEAKGICVARREDNHFINGTKLLNVAGMTRGRRDGILKSEKTRNVVKIGPMHLKGVWIPFERALDFANREKITDMLYPLFVHNISGLLYDPANQTRTNAVVSEAGRRRLADSVPRPLPMSQPPALQHHNTMANPVGAGQSQSANHAGPGRPSLDRAHTFPTPPTSASSVINGNTGDSYGNWPGHSMASGINQNSGPGLSINTELSNARSMPTTPASTPPGNGMSNMPAYQASQGYDTKSYYSAAPPQSSYGAPQDMDNKYSQSNGTYVKSEMGPPTGRGPGMPHEADQQDYKQDPYRQPTSQIQQHGSEGEGQQAHDQEYGNGAYGAARSSYAYGTAASMSSMHGDQAHLSPSMNSSPSQHQASGHVTPRTANPSHAWHQHGYQTPPRQSASSSLYNIMSDPRSGAANGSSDGYANSNYATSTMNGTPGTKRGREDDDQANGTHPSGLEPAFDLKRRRTMRDDGVHSPVAALPAMQSGIKAGGGPRRR